MTACSSSFTNFFNFSIVRSSLSLIILKRSLGSFVTCSIASRKCFLHLWFILNNVYLRRNKPGDRSFKSFIDRLRRNLIQIAQLPVDMARVIIEGFDLIVMETVKSGLKWIKYFLNTISRKIQSRQFCSVFVLEALIILIFLLEVWLKFII